MKLYNSNIQPEIIYSLSAIFGIISVCLIIFYWMKKVKQNDFSNELFLRTRSWGYIAFGIATIVLAPPVIGTLVIGFVSFFALREMISISGFRAADRPALLVAYHSIPIQYYFAYHHSDAFLAFIPIVMSVVIPFVLIGAGKTKAIGRSMALIPAILMLAVFMVSHIVLLFNLQIPTVEMNYGELILYLIILTAFNDVFQFVWGKMLGKRKIIPAISPNKTWEGFFEEFLLPQF